MQYSIPRALLLALVKGESLSIKKHEAWLFFYKTFPIVCPPKNKNKRLEHRKRSPWYLLFSVQMESVLKKSKSEESRYKQFPKRHRVNASSSVRSQRLQISRLSFLWFKAQQNSRRVNISLLCEVFSALRCIICEYWSWRRSGLMQLWDLDGWFWLVFFLHILHPPTLISLRILLFHTISFTCRLSLSWPCV